MKVRVKYRDERVYEAVVDVDNMDEVTEELVNCMDTDEFVESPKEIDGRVEILEATEAGTLAEVFAKEEMDDEAMKIGLGILGLTLEEANKLDREG